MHTSEMTEGSVVFECRRSIEDFDREAWNALGDGHPATRHEFFAALERSRCIGGDSGWRPAYLAGRRDGRLVAAVPLFEKWHSYGEYVFDWAWADAFQRHGLDYYPKWLAASPFSPLPGRRLLGRDPPARRAALAALLALAGRSGASSLHVLFPAEDELAWLRDAGLMVREGVQFHWRRRDEVDFEGFLRRLNHDKRKKIRQDRRRAASHALDYRWIDGAAARSEDWAFFHRCYTGTYRVHHSTPYLNRAFFESFAGALPDAVRLLVASGPRGQIASALFLRSDRALYGRYWGSLEHLPCLHFELCYYRPIEYCLEHGIDSLEGGAQGEHKLSRGMEPVKTYSAHWIADPRFADAIARHLRVEQAQMADYAGELERRTPFRQT